MCVLRFAVPMSCVCLLVASLSASQEIRPLQAQAWNDLQARSNGTLQISWDPLSGTPALITNEATRSATPGRKLAEPGRAAQEFFSRNADLFPLRGAIDGMRVNRTIADHPARTHIALRQTYRGVPVEDGGYTLTLNADGSLIMLAGSFHPGIELDVAPRLKPREAYDFATRLTGTAHNFEPPNAEVLVLPAGRDSRLVYSVTLRPNAGSSRQVLVDAHSGALVANRNLLIYDVESDPGGDPPAPETCDPPKGMAYNLDACTSSPFPYDLTRLNPPFTELSGKWIQALKYSAPLVAMPCGQFTGPLFTPPSDFRDAQTPDDSRFDESNLYYHIDQFTQWLVLAHNFEPDYKLTPTGAPVRYIKAHAQYYETPGVPYANAHFNPATMALYFGTGDYQNVYDAAKDNDVIYHETFHAYSWSRGLRTHASDQNHASRAIHEGYADYFSGSFREDPEFGVCYQAGCIFPHVPFRTCATSWDGEGGWRVNNIQNAAWTRCDGSVVAASEAFHIAGMIWSGTLWDLRVASGAPVANQIAFNAIYYLVDQAPTWQMMGAALLQAARGAGQDCVVKPILRNRGFYGPTVSAPTLTSAVYLPAVCDVRVQWTMPAADAPYIDGFNVYRNDGLVGTVGRGDRQYDDGSPPAGANSYTVKAVDCGVEVSESNPGSVTVPGAPSAPTGVGASDGTGPTVQVVWMDNSLDETSFSIERRFAATNNLDQTFSAPSAAGTGQRSWADNGAAQGTLYRYCVMALNGCLVSGAGCDNGHRSAPPLNVSVSGPTSSSMYASVQYGATISGGTPPYTFQWYKAAWCPGQAANSATEETESMRHSVSASAEPGPVIMIPPCNQFYPMSGATSQVVTTLATYDFTIRCVVVDAGGASGQAQINVDVIGATPPDEDPPGHPIDPYANAMGLIGMWPSPAHGTAQISFAIAEAGVVRLELLDIAGRSVALLENGWRPAGRHTVVWNTSGAAPGVYVLRLSTADRVEMKRATVVR